MFVSYNFFLVLLKHGLYQSIILACNILGFPDSKRVICYSVMILTQSQSLPSNIVLNTDPSLNPLNEVLMILRILYLACAPKGTLIKVNIDWSRIAFP